jgi:hypothetical protein
MMLLIFGLTASSAPQQAASAAVAVALAVLPYCFARAVHLAGAEGRKKKHERAVLERLDKLIEAQTKSISGNQ